MTNEQKVTSNQLEQYLVDLNFTSNFISDVEIVNIEEIDERVYIEFTFLKFENKFRNRYVIEKNGEYSLEKVKEEN